MKIKTQDGIIEVSASNIQELGEDESPTDIPGVQDEINRVASKTRKEAQRSTKKQLLKSDDFWKKAATKRGVELREDDLRPKGATAGETAKLRERVDQLKEKAELADKLHKKVKEGRKEQLKNRLLQQAGHVKDDLKDVFLDHAVSKFGYDSDDDVHVPVGEEGQLDFTRTVDDVIGDIQKDKPSLLKNNNANSTGTNPSNKGINSLKTYTESEVQRLMNNAANLSNDEYDAVMQAVRDGRVVSS